MANSSEGELRPAVFLDRDGTLNIDTGYVRNPTDVALAPGAGQGAALLADAGFVLVIASNQSGIARGFLTEAQADAVDARLLELLQRAGVSIAGMYRCPHLAQGSVAQFAVECDCRKPKAGLLLRAARELGLDLRRSWAIGDRPRDIEAGLAAGCKVVAVESAGPAHAGEHPTFPPRTLRAATLVEAAHIILESAA